MEHSSNSKRHSMLPAVASMVGTTIEWYDFFIYGTAAALIFNKLFFPKFDPSVGTLAAFATYAVGFFARPLGGIVFGHFGDKVGRKSMLLITLMLMGIPTTLIGLVPTYDSIGIFAPILLVVLRLTQGLAIGGEWGGAALMSVEHAPAGKRGLFGSLTQAGVAPGLVLSSLAMALVSRLPEADLYSWGWRIPFLSSVLLLVVGWFIRIRVAESPVFARLKAQRKDVRAPLMVVLRHHWKKVLLVIGARMAEVTWFYSVITFSLAYATNNLGIPKSDMLYAVTVGAVVMAFTMPALGMLGDRLGQRQLYMAGTILLCLFAFPFFHLLAMREMHWLMVAVIPAVALIYPLMYGQQATFFSAQFPPEVRYSGISLCVQLSSAIGGGIAPIIATALVALAGGSPVYVCIYLIVLGVIAWLCVKAMPNQAYEQ